MDRADVCGTSSRASRCPPDVISAVAILDPRWRRRKWRHPGPGAVFSTPIAAAAQDGGPSASGRHLGWPHLRNRKWGHPRWRPEAEGPPSCAAAALGVEKTALYYLGTLNKEIGFLCGLQLFALDIFCGEYLHLLLQIWRKRLLLQMSTCPIGTRPSLTMLK